MVVIAITAVFFVITSPSLLAARNQAMVDAVTEDIITTVRLAQNNAISIKEDEVACTVGNLKGWAVSFNYDSNNNLGSYSSGSICLDGDSQMNLGNLTENNKQYETVRIGSDGSSSYTIFFMTPFGKSYLVDNDDLGDDVVSFEQLSNRPEKDYRPIIDLTTIPDQAIIKISLQDKYSKNIVINSNGDIHAEEFE